MFFLLILALYARFGIQPEVFALIFRCRFRADNHAVASRPDDIEVLCRMFVWNCLKKSHYVIISNATNAFRPVSQNLLIPAFLDITFRHHQTTSLTRLSSLVLGDVLVTRYLLVCACLNIIALACHIKPRLESVTTLSAVVLVTAFHYDQG